MTLQILDLNDSTLRALRLNADSQYRKFLVKNDGGSQVDDVKLRLLEAGYGISDAAYLSRRSEISMVFTRQSSLLVENHKLGVDSVAVMTDMDDAELEAIQLDGYLQISPDSFTWASMIMFGPLEGNEMVEVYARFRSVDPAASSLDYRFTIRNIGSDTFQSVMLTKDGTDQLSLDGNLWSDSVDLGDMTPGTVKTVYLRTSTISAVPIPAEISAYAGSELHASLPFDVASGRLYCSVIDVRNYLQTINVDVISDDEEIHDLIVLSANEIDRATRRRFDVVTATEMYDGAGQQKLVLDQYPIIQVNEIKIYNLNRQIITDIKKTDSDFASKLIIDLVNGFVTLPSASYYMTNPYFWPNTSFASAMMMKGTEYDYSNRFGKGVANVEVNYTYGFKTPPEGIRDACKKMVIIEMLKKKGASDTQGSSVISIAGMTETFTQQAAQRGSGPFAALIGDLQADIDATLEQHRKRRLLVI